MTALSLALVTCSNDVEQSDVAMGGVSEALLATAPPGTTQFTPVPRGSRWGYKDDGSNPGTLWRLPAAVDLDHWVDPWPEAKGPLGYGESYLASTLSYGADPANKYITTYFRRFFNILFPPKKMFLRVMYDDGFVFYINGKEGGRASMPSGPVSFSTPAAGHEANQQYITFDISAQIPNLMSSSLNTLSFEVHQNDRFSSDLVFDAELIVWYPGSFNTVNGMEVPQGSNWSFWDRGGDLGALWREPDFDASTWSVGPGSLGFGESYLATEISPGPITSYFRTQFYAAGPVQGMSGKVMYDDGFVAYLNGHEIGRSSMPAGPVAASTLAGGHEAENAYQSFDWSSALPYLKLDDINTLAVEVHQVSATSSDLVFDLALHLTRLWELQPDRAPGPLHGVWSIDAQHGFAVGAQGALMKTTNGGQQWTLVPTGTIQTLDAIQFVDAQHGWIVGDGGTILATLNGGATWTKQSVATAKVTPDFYGLSFTSPTHGWLIGGSVYGYRPYELFRTTDGGQTWTGLPVPEGSYNDVAFVDDLHGWLVGSIQFDGDTRGAIFGTSDGGATWTRQWVAPHHFNVLYDVEPINATTAWVVGQGSTSGVGEILLVTHDAGATWQSTFAGIGTGLLAIDFVDESFGWAVGVAGGIAHTGDGGATWTVQEPSRLYFKPWLSGVHFADRKSGFAVGVFGGIGDDRGVVLHTSTGGQVAPVLPVNRPRVF